MTRRYRHLLSGFLMLLASQVCAQSYVQSALIFSRTNPGGSARIKGIGGAQTSLGGDYSSAYSNPAGLGFFNRNEFTVSPSLNFSNVSSDFLLGDSLIANQSTSQTNFTLPGISVVFHNDLSGESNSVISGNFAISLNRINDFNSSFNYRGTNPYSSIINAFINTANGQNSSQFSSSGDQYLTPSWLAYQNFLIGDSSINKVGGNPNAYFTDATQLPYYRNGVPTQSESVQTSGGQNQINVGYGINIRDKVYLGASLGITSLRYSSRKSYKEKFDSGPLASLSLDESLDITGSGFNLTIGTIYKPIDYAQIGFAISTPTFYTLSDTYYGDMSTVWKNYTYYLSPTDNTKFVKLNNESASTDELTTNYTLSTPWKFNGGITFLLAKKGFVSADLEYINFGGSSYNSATDGVSFDDANSGIKSAYKSVFNIRVGAEYRVKNFRFRAGYSSMPDPSSSIRKSTVGDINNFTLGGGYRTQKFYIDAGVVIVQTSGIYRPYPVPWEKTPIVKNSITNSSVVFTVGFPF